MNVGKQLKNLLERENISQKQLAGDLKLHTSTLSGYVRNHRQPDLDTIAQLAAYFHTSADYLLGLSSCQTPNCSLTPKEQRILAEYRQIPSAIKPLFLRILHAFASMEETSV